MSESNGLIEHCKRELQLLEKSCVGAEAKRMQKLVTKNIMDVVKVFAKQEHSGFSAGYTINLLNRLLRWKPIGELRGDNSEWTEYIEGNFKNKRRSSVFKDKDGTTFDIDGIVFYQNGSSFTSGRSRTKVTFPYDVPEQSIKVYLKDDVECDCELPPFDPLDIPCKHCDKCIFVQ
ncbi:MAG: hypothetical protein Pg6A_19610 [Termitinemataceae bacterium]|nr:MAG: hypothetical protein Pg6A_19610 [Termitinemataceae bacterium]